MHRERWHLEQRTISKDETGGVDSAEERGVMDPETPEDCACRWTDEELILEMRYERCASKA